MPDEEFTISCPHCGQHLSFDASMFNQKFECPSCGKEVRTPPKPESRPECPEDSSVMTDEHILAPLPDPGTAPIVIEVIRRGDGGGRRRRLLRKIGIAVAVVAVVGVAVALCSGKGGSGPSNASRSGGDSAPASRKSPSASPSKTLTQGERQAIGKIFYTMTIMEANKSKMASQLSTSGTADKDSAEILAAVSGMVIAESLKGEDAWSDCPPEFQRVIMDFCVAKGKAEISSVIEKHGRQTVRDTLARFKVHANFTKFYDEVMKEGASSVARELERSQAVFRSFQQTYGLTGNDILASATQEFTEKRMSASGLCKEFVGNKKMYTFIDDHTVQWDVGGETPPFLCVVSFSDDGKATLVQDNTFFAREYSGTPATTLARRLEQSFSRSNPYETEIKNVKAIVQNGHLYFSGEIQVSAGHVEDQVNQVFKALNQARLRLRFL